MSIGQPQGMLLNQFGMLLWDAFGEVAYHVGSSLTTQKTKDWRDVDVRLMLDDETWDKMELGNPDNPHQNRKWRALCVTFSEYGRHLTGLPIDFQLQQSTQANKQYSSKDGHSRSALIVSTVDAVPAARAGDAVCGMCKGKGIFHSRELIGAPPVHTEICPSCHGTGKRESK